MAITSELVARKCKDGLQKAQKHYQDWSGWSWPLPECVATVETALTVNKAVRKADDRSWVTPEFSVRKTLKKAGLRPRPGPKHGVLPKQGRFDIVAWIGERPIGVIEVKTRGTSLERDMERVSLAISLGPSIRWGIVATMIAIQSGERKSAEDRLRTRMGSRIEEAGRVAVSRGVKFNKCWETRPKQDDSDGGSWAVQVFEFRR